MYSSYLKMHLEDQSIQKTINVILKNASLEAAVTVFSSPSGSEYVKFIVAEPSLCKLLT